MSHWYCPECKERKEPEQVTFQENCSDCGTEIKFIDTLRGILFSKLQGEFYELTGQKPLKYVDKKVVGAIEYVWFLESKL